MATIDQLTAAAVVALNANDFGETFTAVENFVPRIKREDMGSDWYVWIVTADLKSTRVSRSRSRAEPSFDIGLIKKLPDTEPATVGPCLALADAVQTFVASDMKDLVGHDLTQTDFDPLWSPEHLKQQSVFFSVLAITYRRRS